MRVVAAQCFLSWSIRTPGANHVLPTEGRARSFSGLSVQHFLRSYTIQEVTPEAAAAMSEDVATLAMVEGLPGHAAAARARSGT